MVECLKMCHCIMVTIGGCLERRKDTAAALGYNGAQRNANNNSNISNNDRPEGPYWALCVERRKGCNLTQRQPLYNMQDAECNSCSPEYKQAEYSVMHRYNVRQQGYMQAEHNTRQMYVY